jgi:hypothetical protein
MEMSCERRARAVGAWVLAGLVIGGCGGGGGTGAAGTDGATGVAVDLAYTETGSPRAAGVAQVLAAAAPDRDRASVATVPEGTSLRLTVEGPDFTPIVCEFPKKTGGRCDGIPAGTGRTVTVEEWDNAFEILYFRGRALGVRVEGGRDTRVVVKMRPPVAIRYPAEDAALNGRTFEALVQADPGATVQLFIGQHPVGQAVTDASGVAALRVDSAGPGAAPPEGGGTGLADGDYLLTAVAFPRRTAGDAAVRHVGAPLSFEVDLRPPMLQVSAPTVTNALAVDLDGVTEPGAIVRCGEGAPAAGDRPVVLPDGRFRLPAVPIGPVTTQLACASTDRAGNTAVQTLTIVHRPDGFTIDANLPTITNQPQATLQVQTAPTVDDLVIEVSGTGAAATRSAVVPDALDTGTFSIAVDLHQNQWNHVKVTARIAGVALGETVLAVEHDNVPPVAPTPTWWSNMSLSIAQVVGNRLYYDKIQVGFTPTESATSVEVYDWSGVPLICCDTPGTFIAAAEGNRGYIDVPAGKCFAFLVARAVDRAGNISTSGTVFLSPVMGVLTWCVR